MCLGTTSSYFSPTINIDQSVELYRTRRVTQPRLAHGCYFRILKYLLHEIIVVVIAAGAQNFVTARCYRKQQLPAKQK